MRGVSTGVIIAPVRVASLLPSATEIVCALGARDQLVGVSHECDYPPGVDVLPVLTRARQALPRGSGAIDRTVREILRSALGVYEIDVDRLREARPDVVVTQDLCDVCAVSIEDVRRALAELAGRDIEVVNLRPKRLADVWEDVRLVGRSLGRNERSEKLAADLEHRTRHIAERAAKLQERPSVLSIEWLDPVMIGGMWMPELVTLAGGTSLVTEPGQHAPTLTRDQLAELDPDVVLIKPCGFDVGRTSEDLALLPVNLPWEHWKAVRAGRVYVADGNSYFNRPGPRLVESLEILAACVHPDAFQEFRRTHAASVRRLKPGLTLEPFFPG